MASPGGRERGQRADLRHRRRAGLEQSPESDPSNAKTSFAATVYILARVHGMYIICFIDHYLSPAVEPLVRTFFRKVACIH